MTGIYFINLFSVFSVFVFPTTGFIFQYLNNISTIIWRITDQMQLGFQPFSTDLKSYKIGLRLLCQRMWNLDFYNDMKIEMDIIVQE